MTQSLLFTAFFTLMLVSCSAPETEQTNSTELTFPSEDHQYDSDTLVVQLNDSLAARTVLSGEQSQDMFLYKRAGTKWQMTQRIDSLDFELNRLVPEARDVNGDGLDDIMLYHTSGARSGNQLSYIFLFNPHTGLFEYLPGSTAYPNIEYDPQEQAFLSIALTVGTRYIWLRLQGDSLKPYKEYWRGITSDSLNSWIVDEYYDVENGNYILTRTDSFPFTDSTKRDLMPTITN